MKNWIIFGFFLCTFLAWRYYSNPRGHEIPPESFESAALVPLPALWADDNLHNRPVWVAGYVSTAFSTKIAGAYVLVSDDDHDLIILARGFTPESDQMVAALIIPREVLLLNDQLFLVAAQVDFRYLNPEDFEKKPDFKST